MPSLDFGPFRLVTEQHVLLEDGKPVPLARRALAVLALLVERAGEVVAKGDIARHVWRDAGASEANIRVHISAIRQALGDGRRGVRYISNIANRGYCFVADVTQSSDLRAASEAEGVAGANRWRSLSRVIGRAEAIEALVTLLRSRRLISIVGSGGIGKTTIARGVLERESGAFQQRVDFADLAPVTDPTLLPSVINTALGLAMTNADPLRTLLSHLAEEPFLLVLDNCEHLVAAVAELAEALLKGTTHVRILATSRESLKAEGEFVYRLPPLETPSRGAKVSAREAARYSAIELFVERAAASADGFALEDGNAGAIVEICRRVDGIPLAIELAAAAVNTFGTHSLSSHLEQSFALLSRGRRTALPRQRTLRATLDWSYDLLPERERTLLRRLAIFPNFFSIDAARALSTDSGVQESSVLDDLGNLIDKSLVVLNASDDLFLFRLLDATRAYAGEKLIAAGEQAEVARRHALYFCALLNGIAGSQSGEGEFSTHDPRILLDHVRSALAWAAGPQADPSTAVALTLAAVPLWAQLSLTEECVGHLKRARNLRQHPGAGDRALEAELSLAEGLSLLYSRGPQPEAGAALQHAVKLERSTPHIEDVDRIMRTYNALSLYFNVRSEPRSSLAVAWQFQRRLRRFKQHRAQSIAEYSLGTALHSLGAQRAALEHLDRSIGGYDLASRPWLTSRLFMDRLTSARVIRAWTLWLLGYPEQANRQAAAAADDVEHVLSRCFALFDGVATMALLCGDLDQLERATQAVGVILETHLLPNWRLHHAILTHILTVRRQPSAHALVDLEESIAEWASMTGYRHRLAMLVALLAQGHAEVGQLSEAHRVLAPIRSMAEQGAIPWFMAELLRIEGELGLSEGTLRGAELAERRFHESLHWARDQAALGWELRTATSLARLWHERGDTPPALELLAPVLRRFDEGFATADLQHAQRLLARMTDRVGQLTSPDGRPALR